ncbi:MAG: hypothetical protein ACLP7F_03435 [Acidimicrobiales bacterium]
MREPRRGLPWSGRRARRRAEYRSWMSSSARLGYRERWRSAGPPPTALRRYVKPAAALGTSGTGTWTTAATIAWVASSTPDVVPTCRPCHRRLHRILESSPVWLWLGREQAGDVIMARLRSMRNGHDG